MRDEIVLPFEFDPVLACTAIITLMFIGLAIHWRSKPLQSLTLLVSMFGLLVLTVGAMDSWPPLGCLDGSEVFEIAHPLNRVAIGAVASLIAFLALFPSVPAALVSKIEQRPIEPLASWVRWLAPLWLVGVVSGLV
jgi:hypothetical protein